MRRAAELAALVALVPLLSGFSVLEKRDPEIEAGNAALKAGKAEDALGHYDRAVKKLAADAGAHFDRGAALYALSRFDEAGQEFLKATEAKDAALKEGAFYNLGNAFFKKEKFKEAVAAYTRALGLRPDDKQAKWNLEIALRKQQEKEQKDKDKKNDDQKNKDDKDQKQSKDDQKKDDKSKPDDKKQDQDSVLPAPADATIKRTTRKRTIRSSRTKSSSPSRSPPTTGNRPRRCWTTWNAAPKTSRRNARACAPCAARRRSATGETRLRKHVRPAGPLDRRLVGAGAGRFVPRVAGSRGGRAG